MPWSFKKNANAALASHPPLRALPWLQKAIYNYERTTDLVFRRRKDQNALIVVEMVIPLSDATNLMDSPPLVARLTFPQAPALSPMLIRYPLPAVFLSHLINANNSSQF
jgi:hypothetical protein